MTNKDLMINIFVFAAGAAIGSAVTWKLVKTKYEQIAQEEIDSVKEVFAKRASMMKPSLEEYKAKLDDLKYEMESEEDTEKEDTESMDKKTSSAAYVISPEEFGDCGYDTISLTYFADGVVADDFDEPIEDVEDLIGPDALDSFGEFEDDSVFVRNDEKQCDYEILLDVRNHADI